MTFSFDVFLRGVDDEKSPLARTKARCFVPTHDERARIQLLVDTSDARTVNSRISSTSCLSLVVRRHPRARAVVPMRCYTLRRATRARWHVRGRQTSTRDTSTKLHTKLHTIRPVGSSARGVTTFAQFYPVRREVFAHSLVFTRSTLVRRRRRHALRRSR